MKHTTWFRLPLLLALLTPIAVTSTPPQPSPFRAFEASGTLTSRNTGDVGNYTVVLMGLIDGEWRRLHTCAAEQARYYGGAQDIAITDRYGGFWLNVWSYSLPESIAPAVVLPDTTLLGTSVARRDLNYQDMYGTYELDDGDSLCDDGEKVNVVEGYLYFGPDTLTVIVP